MLPVEHAENLHYYFTHCTPGGCWTEPAPSIAAWQSIATPIEPDAWMVALTLALAIWVPVLVAAVLWARWSICRRLSALDYWIAYLEQDGDPEPPGGEEATSPPHTAS